MRYLYTFLISICTSFALAQSTGEIIFTEKGSYKLIYEEQIINFYFSHAPRGDFDNLVVGLVLTREEQTELIHSIKRVIDQLPADIRAKYLGIDIFMLTILNETITGYYFNNQLIIEIDANKLQDLKPGNMTFTFGHELAHHILNRSEGLQETNKFLDYLKTFRMEHPAMNYGDEVSFRLKGYYSKYSYNQHGKGYCAREEFADLIGLFLINDPILHTALNQSEYALFAEKLRHTNNFLKELAPSLAIDNNYSNNFASFTPEIEVVEKEVSKPEVIASTQESASSEEVDYIAQYQMDAQLADDLQRESKKRNSVKTKNKQTQKRKWEKAYAVSGIILAIGLKLLL
jgi:hypothetical protein